MSKDYYKILGIDENASQAQVKSAIPCFGKKNIIRMLIRMIKLLKNVSRKFLKPIRF